MPVGGPWPEADDDRWRTRHADVNLRGQARAARGPDQGEVLLARGRRRALADRAQSAFGTWQEAHQRLAEARAAYAALEDSDRRTLNAIHARSKAVREGCPYEPAPGSPLATAAAELARREERAAQRLAERDAPRNGRSPTNLPAELERVRVASGARGQSLASVSARQVTARLRLFRSAAMGSPAAMNSCRRPGSFFRAASPFNRCT
jgi:hypothetical protein